MDSEFGDAYSYPDISATDQDRKQFDDLAQQYIQNRYPINEHKDITQDLYSPTGDKFPKGTRYEFVTLDFGMVVEAYHFANQFIKRWYSPPNIYSYEHQDRSGKLRNYD